MSIYVVQPGDSVNSIAGTFGVSPEELIFINQIPSPYPLAVGQALYLPITGGTAEGLLPGNTAPLRSATVGGYAYPFISPYVLSQSLPYLTDLFIFSYGFTAEGLLLPPPLNPDWMISAALLQGVRPILTLTPFDASGQFSNFLISEVINNATRVERLISEVINEVQTKGFQGVDVDFEFIRAEDRDAFVAFVARMQEAVSALGYETSVALAPKTSSGQQGLLYEGKDYPGLGAVADYVLLMTYEWGYKYGPPMSVAPINQVRRVVEYAVTEIPPEKIHLGIPNYGYDWPLPFIAGQTSATVIGNVEAVQLAIQNSVPIQFDATAQSPFFFYNAPAAQHEVWFEDVRDFQEKYRLIAEYGLRGMSYWTIMQLFRAGWYQQADYFIPSRNAG